MTRRDQAHRDQPLFAFDTPAAPVCPVPGIQCKVDGNRLARTTDPATSKAAADRVSKSEERRIALRDALRLVRENPGRTAYELDDLDKQPGQPGYLLPNRKEGRIRRRLHEWADCENPQLERGHSRKCFVNETTCQTWWPIGMAPQNNSNQRKA